MLLLQILYLIYNSIRSIWNLYLIFPLSYFRFYGFILPLVEFENLFEFVLITSFLYPFLKMIEFTKQPRYRLNKISKIVGNTDMFRIKYYSVVVMLLLVLMVALNVSIVFLLLTSYYLIFRIATFFMIIKSKNIKNELLKHTKSVYREEVN